jgi:hypothetical protein
MELNADSLNVGDVLIFDGDVLHRGNLGKRTRQAALLRTSI